MPNREIRSIRAVAESEHRIVQILCIDRIRGPKCSPLRARCGHVARLVQRFPATLSQENRTVSDIDNEIRGLVEQFVEDMTQLLKVSALEAVRDALGETGAATGKRATKRRATKKRSTKRRATKKRTTKRRATKKRSTTKRATKARGAKKTGRRGRPRRQSDAVLERLSQRVTDHVKKNPGARLEEISKALKTPSKDLKRPVSDLLEGKKLRKTGEKRGTKYFVK